MGKNRISTIPDISSIPLKYLYLDYNYLTSEELTSNKIPDTLDTSYFYDSTLNRQVRSLDNKIVVLDEYYPLDGKLPFRVEYHTTDRIDRTYYLDILEGADVIAQDMNSNGSIFVGWDFDDLSNKLGTSGSRTLTFRLKDSEKNLLTETTKTIEIGREEAIALNKGLYASVDDYNFSVNLQMYDGYQGFDNNTVLLLLDSNNNIVGKSNYTSTYISDNYYSSEFYWNYTLKRKYMNVNSQIQLPKKLSEGKYQLAYSFNYQEGVTE